MGKASSKITQEAYMSALSLLTANGLQVANNSSQIIQSITVDCTEFAKTMLHAQQECTEMFVEVGVPWEEAATTCFHQFGESSYSCELNHVTMTAFVVIDQESLQTTETYQSLERFIEINMAAYIEQAVGIFNISSDAEINQKAVVESIMAAVSNQEQIIDLDFSNVQSIDISGSGSVNAITMEATTDVVQNVLQQNSAVQKAVQNLVIQQQSSIKQVQVRNSIIISIMIAILIVGVVLIVLRKASTKKEYVGGKQVSKDVCKSMKYDLSELGRVFQQNIKHNKNKGKDEPWDAKQVKEYRNVLNQRLKDLKKYESCGWAKNMPKKLEKQQRKIDNFLIKHDK